MFYNHIVLYINSFDLWTFHKNIHKYFPPSPHQQDVNQNLQALKQKMSRSIALSARLARTVNCVYVLAANVIDWWATWVTWAHNKSCMYRVTEGEGSAIIHKRISHDNTVPLLLCRKPSRTSSLASKCMLSHSLLSLFHASSICPLTQGKMA